MSHDDSAAIFVLDIPAPCAFINANDRGHWAPKAKATRAWRKAAHVAALQAHLPQFKGHVTIVATIHKASANRYDASNWAPTGKAAIDGLRDARTLLEDSNEYVTGPDMRPGERSPRPYLRLLITPTQEKP